MTFQDHNPEAGFAEQPCSTKSFRANLTREHLERLWPDGIPEGTVLALWRGDTKTTRPARSVAEAVELWAEIEPTLAPGASLYLSTSASDPSVVGVKGQKGGESDVLAVPALWADIDLDGGAHKAKNLPTEEEWHKARTLLAEYGLHLSLELWSSHGGRYGFLQLREPFEIENEEDRARIASAALRFEAFVRGALAQVCGAPRALDSCSNLDRILRPAGALNFKPGNVKLNGGAAPVVRTLTASPRRYNLSEIEDILDIAGEFELLAGESGAVSAFTGELPNEVPAWIAKAIEFSKFSVHHLGGSGGVSSVVLAECPYCGRGPKDNWPSHVATVAGTLRCKRASCKAIEGVRFSEWAGERLSDLEFSAVLTLKRGDVAPAVDTTAPVTSRGAFAEMLHPELVDAAPGELLLVASPTGAGKTRALMVAAFEQPNLAMLFVNHERCEEFIGAMKAHAKATGQPVPRYVYRKGIATGCEFKEHLIAEGLTAGARMNLCNVCDHWRKCDSTQRADAPDELVIATHASYRSLAKGIRVPQGETTERALQGRTVVFDEIPEFAVEAAPFSADMIANEKRALQHETDKGMQQVRDLAEFACDWLTDIMRRANAAHPGESFPDHVSLDELRHLALAGKTEEAIAEDVIKLEILVARCKSRKGIGFWSLSASRVFAEAKAARETHKGEIERLWAALLAAVGGKDDKDREGLRRAHGRLSVRPRAGKRAAEFQVRTVNPLGIGGERSVVILSAVIELKKEELATIAGPLTPRTISFLAPKGGLRRVHVFHDRASRKAQLDGDGLRTKGSRTVSWGILSSALAAVRADASEEAREALGGPLGLLAYKPVRKALDKDEEAMKTLALAVVGHYGNDDTGSRAFEECRALVTLGEPRANGGAVSDDAITTGESAEARQGRLIAVTLLQSGGRLRGEWRAESTVHIHVGPTPPRDWIQGEYETVRVKQGKPLSDAGSALEGLVKARIPLSTALIHKGLISAYREGVCRHLCAPSKKAMKDAMRRAAEAAGYRAFSVRIRATGQQPKLWVHPSWGEEEAEAFAAWILLGKSPEEAARLTEDAEALPIEEAGGKCPDYTKPLEASTGATPSLSNLAALTLPELYDMERAALATPGELATEAALGRWLGPPRAIRARPRHRHAALVAALD
tara:strand:+ start:2946 stop:6401 length:3456 start_codon:yes stop_codon:yes gene_type:complete